MTYTILGGTIGAPVNLTISGVLPVSAEVCFGNARQSKSRGLKTYRDWKSDRRALAVVGGGPSIRDHIETLQNFDGDVWAINGAWKWCKDNGFDAVFFACDPHPIVAQWAVGASKALLEESCATEAFDALRTADVYTFDADVENGGIAGCASTASVAPHLAIRMGYRSVKFFGCESSYFQNMSHAYMDEGRTEEMIIRCNGDDFLTAPDLFLQALGLSDYIRRVPEFLSEASGGLLGAMVADPKYHIHWMSQALLETLYHAKVTNPVSPAYKPVSGAVAMADNLEAFGLTEKDVAA